MSSGENEYDGGAGRLLAGRYRIVEQLGRGGMGVVCRAVDEVLGREVAVKELRTFTDSSGPELADLRLRMQREARAAARIRHPGVVAVHDVAEEGGRPVIVMELIDGPSLDGVLGERGVIEAREAAALGARVAEALGAAHRAGVLHRDVKPGNILLDRGGRVVLTDFGIAAMDDPGDGSTTHLTRSGEIVGSLDYLAPERAQGQEPGPASDVWALGATLYAAVEGASPFRRTSTWSTLNAIVVEPLPEPRRAGPLAPVLRQLLDKDPARRPDAERAAQLLAAVGSGQEPSAAGPAVSPAAPVSPAPVSPAPETSAGPGAGPRVPTVANVVPHQPEGFGPVVRGLPETSAVVPASSRSRGRGRGGAVVAAAVAAVLVAGGALAYVLTGRPDATPGRELAADARPGVSASAGEWPSPGTLPSGAGRSGSPAPSASKAGGSGEKSPSGTAKPPAGGGGDGAAGRSGGTDGGTSGSGSTGGSTGSGSSGGSTTGGGGTTGTPGGGDPAPAPVCHGIGGGKYNCQVWRTAKSYSHSGTEMGVLNAGTNYFYCQADLGRRETYGQWTNVWWARTDDDSGNTGVYVSVVYVKGGDNDQPVPGLPVC
ncbi:protein kinase domain-containing protein [Streptomyces sp. SYSU K21746]